MVSVYPVSDLPAEFVDRSVAIFEGGKVSPENSIKYGADVMPNSCTYRCHQDKGADKTARASWAISAMSPAPAATTTASATATKAPAFELIFAVGALFIATLVRRR